MLILTFNKFKCLKKKRPFGPSILHLIATATNKIFILLQNLLRGQPDVTLAADVHSRLLPYGRRRLSRLLSHS
jgi:hypothetical protein